MIRPSDQQLAASVAQRLQSHSVPLPGISDARALNTFVAQLIESVRRIKYLQRIAARPALAASADPNSGMFDPLKAAVYRAQNGDNDEAWWLVFLAAHFGRHRRTGWKLAADIYGQLGSGQTLTWHSISGHPQQFQSWLEANEVVLTTAPTRGLFGNHRKYESLSPSAERGTGNVVRSYVDWVGSNRGHALLFTDVTQGAMDRFAAFDAMYRSMAQVLGFGRTGRFDYLTLVGNLGLASIEPGLPYLQGATGPLRGARLLFGGSVDADLSAVLLSKKVVDLGAQTQLGMQVFEDAMCNWQKNPTIFVPFRG